MVRSFIKTFWITISVCLLFMGDGIAYKVDINKIKTQLQDEIEKNIKENPQTQKELLEHINSYSNVCGTLIRIADQQYMDIYKRVSPTNNKSHGVLKDINDQINKIKIGREREFGELKNQVNQLKNITSDKLMEIKGDTVMHYNLMYDALIKILIELDKLDPEINKPK